MEADIIKLKEWINLNRLELNKSLNYIILYDEEVKIKKTLTNTNIDSNCQYIATWYSAIHKNINYEKKSLSKHENDNLQSSILSSDIDKMNHCIYVGTRRIIEISTTNKYLINNTYKYMASLIYLDSMKKNYEKIYDIDPNRKISHLLDIQSKYRESKIIGFTYFNNQVLVKLEEKLKISRVKKEVQDHADISFYHKDSKLNTKINIVNFGLAILALVIAIIAIL